MIEDFHETNNEEDKDRELDLPELVDEEEDDEPSPEPEDSKDPHKFVLVSFLQMLFAFLLLNFKEENKTKAITASPHKKKEEEAADGKVLNSSNSTVDGFEVEDLPEIAAAEWNKQVFVGIWQCTACMEKHAYGMWGRNKYIWQSKIQWMRKIEKKEVM